MKKATRDKLRQWQGFLSRYDAAFAAELEKMDQREDIYQGRSRIDQIVDGDMVRSTPHVRNIAAELVEAQVDANIPQPVVTAMRKQDEPLAKLIEDMIRVKLDNLPMEILNDQMERTVPIQGAGMYMLEWDNSLRTHDHVGESVVSVIHPKQLAPQPGVTGDLDEMERFIIKLPQTKEFIRRRYGVDVSEEEEREPGVRGSQEESACEELVTQYVGFYKNSQGGVGLFSWVGDTVLEDLEDCQARRLRRCSRCGMSETEAESMAFATADGSWPGEGAEQAVAEAVPEDGKAPGPGARGGYGGEGLCPYCGGKMVQQQEDYMELFAPVQRSDGSVIPDVDELSGERTRIPYYKPDMYPVFMQKNVSVYGKLLGESDVDKVRDQQNTINRMEKSIIDQLLAAGSYVTLPPDPSIRIDPGVAKVIRLKNVADRNYIGVYDLKCDVEQPLAYMEYVYQEARNIIGITDSYQGRKDTTATSGVAKEFSANQAAGRLQSKKVMKHACWAKLFEAMFKFELAYADEVRPIVGRDINGNPVQGQWNRWDFLEQDEAGQWYWNDQFTFDCDQDVPLAKDRSALWKETSSYFASGAFGDPASIETQIRFWSKMEQMHYPSAGETKKSLMQQRDSQAALAAAGPAETEGGWMR